MKQLVVLSGKGGTGKTSVTAAFAHLAGKVTVSRNACIPGEYRNSVAPHRKPGF